MEIKIFLIILFYCFFILVNANKLGYFNGNLNSKKKF